VSDDFSAQAPPAIEVVAARGLKPARLRLQVDGDVLELLRAQ